MPSNDGKQYKSVAAIRETVQRHHYSIRAWPEALTFQLIPREGNKSSIQIIKRDTGKNVIVRPVHNVSDDLANQCLQAFLSTRRKYAA